MAAPGADPDETRDTGPRSYWAAVDHRVVREAEQIVERAASGSTPMQRWTRRLFEQLDPNRPTDTEE